MIFLACRFAIYCISIQWTFVNGTSVKWTGNQDPNAPEASRVPRSQKYWDEHKIQRPDYAKTDAEIFQERIMSDESLNFKKNFLMLMLFAGLWFYLIRKYSPSWSGRGVGASGSSRGGGGAFSRLHALSSRGGIAAGGGQKLGGGSVSSSSSSSILSNKGSKTFFSFGVSSATSSSTAATTNTTTARANKSLDDAARMARLSRFDSTTNKKD